MDKNKLKVGYWITVSNHKDATWFKIIAIEGFNLLIEESNLYRPQWLDRCYVRKINTKREDANNEQSI